MLTQLIETIILGIIQGFTEWLPISSTGHLRLAERLMQFSSPQEFLIFEFALHIGTLIVTAVFFRREIRKIISALVRLDFKSEDGKLIQLIVAGTIPAMIIGFFLEKIAAEQTSQNSSSIALAFTLSGIIVYLSKLAKENVEEIGFLKAIIIGAAEGIAVIPGLSRSGLTIAAALLLGLKRERAFKFSSLLSIPAVVGAAGYTLFSEYSTVVSASLGLTQISAGVFAAAVAGYVALKILWRALATWNFHFFAFYCWLVSVLLVAFC